MSRSSAKINKSKKDLLNDLIFLGKLTKVVKLKGYDVKIKTLSNEDQSDILKILFQVSDDQKVQYLKLITLSKCIEEINNIEFNSYFEDSEDLVSDKIDFLSKMQASIVDKLFSEYKELYDEADITIEAQDSKN